MTLAEAVETIKQYCAGKSCDHCILAVDTGTPGFPECSMIGTPEEWETPTETNIYDEEEIHENCTVQILRNSLTGEESVGWWENGKEKEE